jgi:hypothetical protein
LLACHAPKQTTKSTIVNARCMLFPEAWASQIFTASLPLVSPIVFVILLVLVIRRSFTLSIVRARSNPSNPL